jgi:hypothetical protein
MNIQAIPGLRLFGTAIIFLFMAVAVSCSSASDDSAGVGDDAAAGVANPASVFCIEQGGTLEIRDEQNGQTGYCSLPDGTVIEEWEYFRQNSPDAP